MALINLIKLINQNTQMHAYTNRIKKNGDTVSRFKKPVTIIILLFLLFPNFISATLNDSSFVQQDQDAVIYIYSGATIYGEERGNKAKIVHLQTPSKIKSTETALKKSTKKIDKKLSKALVKKEIVYKKAQSDKKIYDPFSTDSSSTILVSKKLSPSVSSNNLQYFSKFQNSAIYFLATGKKYLSQDTIFSYSQNRNSIGFYQIFAARPPPISSFFLV